MAFPDDALASGEHVAVHTRPHPKTLLGPAVWLVVVVTSTGYLVTLTGGWSGLAAVVLAVVVLGLLTWLTVVPVIRWRTTHFVVTDRRVIVREGILTREGVDLGLHRIDNVRFAQGLLDRPFGCGTLVVESVSGEELEFEDVPDVVGVYTLLRAGAVGEPG